MQMEFEQEFVQQSDRVKCVDCHPTNPWILSALHTGKVSIWNYETRSLVHDVQVTDRPVRSAKFIPRRDWIVVGADDGHIHVYECHNFDKVKSFEAHSDYVRSVAVHPTLPYLLSASDDKTIKLWNWEQDWSCTRVFEGHSHYVMNVSFNPMETNTFASASLDKTIIVWNLDSQEPLFTLEGHLQGVNCIDYQARGEGTPYLISGSDDHTLKVWDCETKTCMQTIQGHTHNVCAVCVHPELPIIVTGSEDQAILIWNAITYKLESTLNYGLDRNWAIGYVKGLNRLVLGYDKGLITIKVLVTNERN